ncbi:hypothetical protein VZT92_007070 [Zoarces viviparus]|uniref:Uncharacterized protein n=1 Tax=Zoarces viviparus TaxID=48416 RepID=A0AAW1FIW8_ZOAVI
MVIRAIYPAVSCQLLVSRVRGQGLGGQTRGNSALFQACSLALLTPALCWYGLGFNTDGGGWVQRTAV